MDSDWSGHLSRQLSDHWGRSLRPRLAGLTDDEYHWEPTPGMWAVRRKGASSTAPQQLGSGEFLMDRAEEEPDPPPLTTISWRLCHLLVNVLGSRTARHFGGHPTQQATYDFPGSASVALDRLYAAYEGWVEGVNRPDGADLMRSCGSEEPIYVDRPFAELVLHINREVIHHGAEIALLRDLFANSRKIDSTP